MPRRSRSFFLDYRSLKIGEEIGGGASSIVYKGYWNKCPVAIKKWFDPRCDDQTQREFNSEVAVIRDLRHPNIVQFLGACWIAPDLCIVMECLPTSLFDLLYNSKTPIDDHRICHMAMDIVRSMIYLHSFSPPIIHRDLKPSNLLLDRTWKVKLCDFGLAANIKSQRQAGSLPYMAPELLDSASSFNAKVDVYAFGVVLNEIVSRQIPFNGLSPRDIRQKVRNGDRPDVPISTPGPLRDLIKSCWSQVGNFRPSFEDIYDRLEAISAQI